jgi:hypothetical protein
MDISDCSAQSPLYSITDPARLIQLEKNTISSFLAIEFQNFMDREEKLFDFIPDLIFRHFLPFPINRNCVWRNREVRTMWDPNR